MPTSKAIGKGPRGTAFGSTRSMVTSATPTASVIRAETFTRPPASWGSGTAVTAEMEGGVASAVVKVKV